MLFFFLTQPFVDIALQVKFPLGDQQSMRLCMTLFLGCPFNSV